MGVQKLQLKANHTWKSKPGYSICVLERGLVRFDYPSTWIVEGSEGAVFLHDLPPGMECCDLGVSLFRVPLEAIAGIPLDEMLLNSLDAERNPYKQSEIFRIERPALEIVWLEQKYLESTQTRDARFRVALARGEVVCLISMNYWANRAAILEPEWDEVLRTLTLGLQVADPTVGPVVQ